ncbi:MAG: PHP domain-containing protein [Dehalococcoidia bacterium]|nr:PHP domain-containing protein [Dehalococcoidia bacterium]
MRADFHIHTRVSPDSQLTPEALIRACQRKGIDIIAVTDHHAIRGALEVREIAPFPIIIGADLRTADGEIVGLFLEKDIPCGLSAKESVKRIKDQGGIVQVPHPFDRFRRKRITLPALMDILPDVDLIEAFNARTTLRRDTMLGVEFIREHREKHNIRPVGVSDAHTAREIGNAYTDIPAFEGREDFMDALRHASIHGKRTTPLIHLTTHWTVLSKKIGLARS